MSQPPFGPPHPEQPTSGFPQPGPPPGYPQPGAQPGPVPGFPQPGYGQPVSGQPAYGQPVSAQPGYGEQPQYPAPGQPYGYGPPGYPMAPPPKKSKVVPIVLSVVAVVLVLCVGGITGLYFIGKDAVEDEKKATTTPVPASSQVVPTTEAAEPEPTATKAPATVTITEPKKLGGRPKVTDESFADISKEMEKGLASGYPGASTTFSTFYGELGTEDLVLAVGIETPIARPELALTGTFAGIGIGGMKTKNLTPVSTGTLGGAAKCGTARSSGQDIAICSWADEGSIGVLMWYFKKAPQVKAEFPKLRAQIEKKS